MPVYDLLTKQELHNMARNMQVDYSRIKLTDPNFKKKLWNKIHTNTPYNKVK